MTKQRGRKPGSRNGVYAVNRSAEEAERLFADNMALVGYTIKKMEIPFSDDALQDGYIGLWKAALAFDDTHGIRFSSYAIPAIRGEIVRGWQNMNKNDCPVLSLDHLMSDKLGAAEDDGLELYAAVRDDKAADMLEAVEVGEWLRQILGRVENEIVRRRMAGEPIVDINDDFGRPRGWAESKLNKAKKVIKRDYAERMSKNFG